MKVCVVKDFDKSMLKAHSQTTSCDWLLLWAQIVWVSSRQALLRSNNGLH